jgi:RNA polymerase sigma-70 factor (ECF subfamily)
VRGSWATTGYRSIRCESVPTLPETAPDRPTRAEPVTARTTPQSATDTELRRQFEHIAAPLLTTLHRIAWRMTGNVADAEDLLQDTMVKAYTGFPALKSQTHMKAWFVRIMRNIWIDDHRRSQRMPAECLSGDMAEWEWITDARQVFQRRDGVETLAIGPSLRSEVKHAMQSLSDDLSRALYYAYVEGRPYKEIAQLERVPLGTVMSRLHRARQQSRQLLAGRQASSHSEALTAQPIRPANATKT